MKQLSTLLLLVCLSFRVFGQQATMPTQCTNPPVGIQVGGAFTVSPQFACLDFADNTAKILVSNPLSPSGGQLSNLGYIFNFKDGNPLVFENTSSTTVSKPGNYWVMQGGNEKGQAYITCNSFEVIQTEQPDIKVSSCGEKSITVTFLNTPKNQKHGKYRILWGDGSQDFLSQLNFPINITHTYLNYPVSLPQIVAIYTRGGSNSFDVCQSTPTQFSASTSFKPIITYLESDKANNQIKIKHKGLENNVYQVLAQEKGKTMWETLDNTNGTFENTIKNVNLSKNFFFKLSKKDDGCEISVESDTISNIQLGFEYPNELFWDTMIEQISSLRGKMTYTLQRDNSISSLIKGFDGNQNSFSFSEDDFLIFYNNSFRIKAKSGITEILSDIFTLPALSNELSNQTFTNIYPNPSEDFVQLSSTLQLKTVEIVDLQGKIIENQTIENGQVSVKHLPKGKYILRLYGNDKKLLSSKTIIKM